MPSSVTSTQVSVRSVSQLRRFGCGSAAPEMDVDIVDVTRVAGNPLQAFVDQMLHDVGHRDPRPEQGDGDQGDSDHHAPRPRPDALQEFRVSDRHAAQTIRCLCLCRHGALAYS